MSDLPPSAEPGAAADGADGEGTKQIVLTCPFDLGECTPLDVLRAYADERDCYLLESLAGHDSRERYSFVGLPCRERIEIDKACARHYRDGALLSEDSDIDPIAYLDKFRRRWRTVSPPRLSRLNGGLVGYFAYDCVRYFEPRLSGLNHRISDETLNPSIPDIIFLVSNEILIHNHGNGTSELLLISPAEGGQDEPSAQERLEGLAQQLRERLERLDKPKALAEAPADESRWPSGRTGLDSEAHRRAIARIKRYIEAGDVMQVVLSRSTSMPFGSEPLEIYRHLRAANPSPYMYYFNFGDFQLTGSSPETLVRTHDNIATLRPLAGTRKRGDSPAADAALAADLLADEKERAEHLMLIDLGRADLGRVCEIGSVVTTEKMKVEYYSHVMHIVSNVVGRIADDHNPFEVLKAAFPAGTLTGAPKIRAMEIIEELEPDPRGFYGGAVGYFAWNGSMNLAIAIRTAVIKDGRLYYRAGGGIVRDSLPEVEWQETVNKGKIIQQAVAVTA